MPPPPEPYPFTSPTAVEHRESRVTVRGADPYEERHYTVFVAPEENDALDAVETLAPGLVDVYGNGLVFVARREVRVDPLDGMGMWRGVAYYGITPGTGTGPIFRFDTRGGVKHITHSLETIKGYRSQFPLDGLPPANYAGAIGVTDDAVEGVDIVVSNYIFSETHFKPDALVTPAYKGLLNAATGTVNDDTFKGLASGEVLFLGASGGKRGSGDWELTYEFAGIANRDDIEIGKYENGSRVIPPTGDPEIAKEGHDYLWVRFTPLVDTLAKRIVVRPQYAYVERVYGRADFSLLGIGV